MFEFILKRLSNILLRFLLLVTGGNRRLAYIRIYMLLLELGQLTLDETCNISEPSIVSSGFLTAALPVSPPYNIFTYLILYKRVSSVKYMGIIYNSLCI